MFWLLRRWTLPILVIGVLFYWPMIHVLNNGLVGDWFSSLSSTRVTDALWFTIWQAVVSTVICVLVGLPVAYVLYRRRAPGAHLWRATLTVPFAMPTIITGIGFTVFQNGSLFDSAIFWIIVAHLFVNLSVVVRTVGSSWASLPFDTEEAAALGGAGRFRIFTEIVIPQLRPALMSATASVFLYCTASYGLVLVLGGGLVNSVETEIAYAATVRLDLQEASALALMQTVLSVAAFGVSSIGGRSAVGFDVHEISDHQPKLDRRDWPVVLVSVLAMLLIFSPLITIIVRAFQNRDGLFTLQNFADLGGRGARNLLNITLAQATVNSLRNLLIATLLATFIGVLVAYLLSRPTKLRHVKLINRVLDIAFMMPLGVSTIVLGFGYLMTFGSGWLPLRSSWLVVPLIQGLMAIPLVVRVVYPALVTASAEVAEQAATDGASAGKTFFNVELPMVRLTIGAAVGYAAIISLGEFGAASLLAYGNQATLPNVLYQLVSRPGGNNYGMAMAISAIVILLTFAVVFIASWQPRNRRPSWIRRGAFE